MAWRIRMSELDNSGQVIPMTSRVLPYKATTKANAFAFKDNIVTTMLKVNVGRRLPQLDIFEEPDEPAPRQWGRQ